MEGCYPEQLIQLWDSYAKTGQSQNDRPGLIIHCHLFSEKHDSHTHTCILYSIFTNSEIHPCRLAAWLVDAAEQTIFLTKM